MNYNDYLSQIIAFNGDKDIIALREKFNKPSFFEIISKERSETTYSSFLKWLFHENIADKDTCNPIALLLDVLVRRSEEQKTYVDTILNDNDVKRNFATRNVNILSVKAETEKSVSTIAQEILANNGKTNGTVSYVGELKGDELTKIATKSRDRIDLFIDCDIECDSLPAKRLQIIIENKIDSTEGGKKQDNVTGVKTYDEASQTKRYYLGTKFRTYVAGGNPPIDGKDVLQLYVYLTPLTPEKGACSDSHFIQISYQDIVDSILTPMLASSSLSSRSRFFITEFHNQLVFPSLEGTMIHPSIATDNDNTKELTAMWKKYQPLLTHSAIAASEVNLWMIDDVYYDHQPRTELLDLLLAKGVQSPYIIGGQWKVRMQYPKMKELAAQYGIKTDQVDLGLDDSCLELLSSFWDKNKRLLTALINGMEDEERGKTEALLCQLSKRDTTKYNVYYNDKLLNSRPLGKAKTALCIIKKWVSIKKSKGEPVTLDILNDTFPRKYNPYYENGKWFKNLFYEVANNYQYNGEKANGPVQGNWDFDKNGRFDIDTTDGKKVTMLKMWRKDSLEKLVEMVEKEKLFKDLLIVLPAE